MWIYILLSIGIGYALYKEREALGCPTLPDGTDCDNANGKAIRGTDPQKTDSLETLFSKIKKAADFADRWVMWRIALLISVPCTFLIFLMLYKRIPTEIELLTSIFVITALIYFTLNFYKFHLINYAEKNIDDSVDMIRSRVTHTS